MLGPQDYRGVYSIIPTPYKPVQGIWNGENTVDHDETARLVDAVIRDGSAGVLALGTTGEGATVTEAEFRSFSAAVVETARKRVPVFIGATSMGTHETIQRLRYLRDLGAEGSLLGMPMWQPATEEIAVNYYASISEALPGMAIMAYANPEAFRFDYPPSFWAKIAERAPTVTSAKFMNPRTYVDCIAAAKGRINFLPFPEAIQLYAKAAPDALTAVWSTSSSMGPAAIVKMMDAWAKKDMETFDAMAADIKWAGEPIMKPDGIIPTGDFPHYNIQFEKARFEYSGYCRPGPGRPPYDIMPEKYHDDARENARRWNEVIAKYRDA